MDNLIAGGLSAVLFISFVAGLAESIRAVPFMLIVSVVSVMLLVDLTQSLKQGFSQQNRQRDD